MRPRLLLTVLIIAFLVPGATAAIESDVEFVSTPGTANFGYDYKEDVFDGATDPGDDDTAYVFDFDQDNFAYLGKSLLGKQVYECGLTFNAGASDLRTSGFAVVLSQVDAEASAISKGNGKTTEAFSQAVKLWLKEADNTWTMELREIVAGQEVTIKTGTLSASPQSYTSLVVRVDSHQHVVEVQNLAGAVLLQADFDNALDGGFHSQWFVGFGFTDLQNSIVNLRKPTSSSISTQCVDADPQPPELSGEVQTPTIVASSQVVQVSVTVTDDWSNPLVKLNWWLDGVPQAAITMTRSGSTYRANLAGQADGAVVRYQVTATDSSDLTTAGNTWQYTVGSGTAADTVGDGGGGGGGGSLFRGDTTRVGIMVGVTLMVLGLVLFFLLRDERKALSVTLLLLFIFAGLGVAFFGAIWGTLRDAVSGWPWYYYALGAVPLLGLGYYVLQTRRAPGAKS